MPSKNMRKYVSSDIQNQLITIISEGMLQA